MQNRTDLAGAALPEQARQWALRNEKWLRAFGALLAGYGLAGARLYGGISPFGVALCASLQGGYAIGAALGAALGYLLTPGTLSMKYIAAIALLCGFKWLLGARREITRSPVAANVLCCFTALGVSSCAAQVLSGATLYQAVLAFAELSLTCGSAYFFTRALQNISSNWAELGRSDISCMVVSFALIIAGLSSFSLGGVSAGRVLAVFVILLCARYGGEGGGAVSGITAGAALGLAGGDFSYAITAYGFGGLMAGVFGSVGRLAAAGSFIALNTAAALLTKEYAQVYAAILEVFAASVLFVAVPASVASRLRLLRGAPGRAASVSGMQNALRGRMEDVSAALEEISATTHKVSERLGRMENGGISAVYAQAAETVCACCSNRLSCWQAGYADTMAALNDCTAVLRRENGIARGDLPAHFSESCLFADELSAEISKRFQEYAAREGLHLKVSKVRAVVTDQFQGMAMMLNEISREVCAARLQDTKRAARAREYFEKGGIPVLQAHCFINEHERITLEITLANAGVPKLGRIKSALDLCGILEAEMDPPQIIQREKYATAVYTEKPVYSVDFGAYQIPMGQNRLCGDAYDYIRNCGGKAHFVLSDGMGSGGSAAVDSSMASGLTTRLLSVGVGYEATLKLVNSALLLKSEEESISTLDICTIDLYTGKAEFRKAGAAPTFLLKNGKAGHVEAVSLPAGILCGVAFEQSSITLHEGDMVILVSDGVIAAGMDWLGPELETLLGTDIQRLCEKLALSAKLRRTDGREDDITVMAVALRRNL